MKSKGFTTCLLVVGAVVVPGGITTADEPVEPPVDGPVEQPIEEPGDDDSVEPADETDETDEAPRVAVGAPPVPPGPQVAVAAPPVPNGVPSLRSIASTSVAHATASVTRRDGNDPETVARAVAAEIAALIARLVR